MKRLTGTSILLLLLSMILVSCKGGQKTGKTVDDPFKDAPNVVIYESDGTGFGPCEPTISISRDNSEVIMAGSVLDYVHSSTNGGLSWTTKKLTSELGVYGDPCIVNDGKTFYYFHLGDPSLKGWAGDRILESIVMQKSSSKGIVWSDGVEIGKNPPKQQDKEWAAVRPDGKQIVMTWTEFDKYGSRSPDCYTRILGSISEDKGETWSEPFRVSEHEGNCIDDDQTTEGAVPSYGNKDEIYVAYAYDEAIYFDRSMDEGKTWLERDIKVVDHPGGWAFEIKGVARANGMPVTAVDRSRSKNKGRIYINYATGGNDPNIYIVYSDDHGDSWSDPIMVNQSDDGSDQFFTWMAIDQNTGFLYVVYYDKSGLDGNKFHTVVAFSADGGVTWTEHTVSKKASYGPDRDEFFGDYNNIDVYDGKVRPIWTHFDGEKLSVMTALINVGAK